MPHGQHSPWLTASELLSALNQVGIQLDLRTLRFWVAQGVLQPPVRKPFKNADGRVRYYPRETLALISQIQKLQAEGWKLRQIQANLCLPESPSHHTLPTLVQPLGDDEAIRYLRDLLSDSDFRDRRRHFTSADPSSGSLRRIRHYLVARLERWFGRKIAVRATSTFLLSLSQRELNRLLARLKVSPSSTFPSNLSTLESQPPPPAFLLRQIPNTTQTQQELDRVLTTLKTLPHSLILVRRLQKILQSLSTILAKPSTFSENQITINLQELEAIKQQAISNLTYLQQEIKPSP